MQRSNSLSQSPAPPVDAALPGAERLLDRAAVAALVSACHPRPIDDPARVRFESIRYKPGSRLVVSVSARDEDSVAAAATLHAFRRGESAAVVEKLRAAGARTVDVAHDAELELVAARFPVDHELPGLSSFPSGRDGAAYVRRLVPSLIDDEHRLRSQTFRSTLLRLKPGRHAVFRLDFRVRNATTREKRESSLIARVFRPDHAPFLPDVSIAGVTPITLGHDAHRGVAIESFAPGLSLADDADATGDVRTWERVASTLARFHLAGRAPAKADDVFSRARARLDAEASMLASEPSVRVSHARASARVLYALEPDGCHGEVRIHGDLHLGQILTDGTNVRLVDLEKSTGGAPEEDVGSLVDSAIELLFDAGLAHGSAGHVIHDLIDAIERMYRTESPLRLDRRRVLVFAAIAALSRCGAPMRNLHPERVRLATTTIERAERFTSLAGVGADLSSQCP